MSRDAKVVLPFGGEDRTFRLGIGEWRDVQEKCDAGPGEILARLAPPFQALRSGLSLQDILGSNLLGRWRVDDIRVVIHFGLIGGGSKPNDAMVLVKRWVDARPPLEALPTAYQVAFAGVVGAEDEDASGEPQGGTAHPHSPAAS